jgi:catechol 2,3-dioxygenase-like lactoylglutathione lyase family enzyme
MDDNSAAPVVSVVELDHIVIVTADVERQLAWWTGLLGLEGDRVDAWRRGEVSFPSVRITDGCIVDLQRGERTGANVDHVCLRVQPGGVQAVVDSGRFTIVDGGPGTIRYGARGLATSVYVTDPDGNVVELREY